MKPRRKHTGLTETHGDPLLSATDWLLSVGPLAKQLNEQSQSDPKEGGR